MSHWLLLQSVKFCEQSRERGRAVLCVFIDSARLPHSNPLAMELGTEQKEPTSLVATSEKKDRGHFVILMKKMFCL